MTPEEQYLFDIRGYVVVENALGEGALTALNALVDQQMAALEDPDFQTHRFRDLLTWGDPMIALIDHPPIVPYMEGLIGRHFRLDHIYIDVIRKGLSPIGATLHGGGTPHEPSMFYDVQDGRIFNGLTVVAYNLSDVLPGDGGFGCIPGSHKAKFPLPESWINMAESRHECIQAVVGKAGTAVIFTEALTHGALPWVSDQERRTVFYKYNHPAMAWTSSYLDPSAPNGLSDAQKKILGPPRNPLLWDR
jgi:hypothetical protein